MKNLIALFALLLVAAVPLAEVASANTMRNMNAGNQAKRGSLSRTFLQPRAANAAVTFAVTFEQFTQRYAVGGTVEVSHRISEFEYEDEYVYDMDVGTGDLSQPTAFTFPEVEFDGVWRYRIAALEDTPYADRYPSATHVLVEQFEDGGTEEWYEYYRITEQGVDLLAYVSYDPDFDDEPDFYDTAEFGGALTLAVFPLDETLGIYVEREAYYDEEYEQEVTFWQQTAMHGFGTLDLGTQFGGETLTVGAFINDENWQEPGETDPNAVIDFETAYSFFATDGTWLQFYVAQDPDLEDIAYMGEVEIMDIELWRVTPAAVANERGADLPEGLTLSAPYPNPSQGRATLDYTLAEASPVSLALYDVLGRKVATLDEGTRASGTHTATLDASDLPSGVYLARLSAGAHHLTQRVVLGR